MVDVKHVTDADFESEVLKAEGLVLVDFWAPWCGPCQALGPVIEELAGELEGKAKVCKLDTAENPKTPQEYKIMGIPAVLLFKNGEVVENIVGLRTKQDYISIVGNHA